MSADVGQCRHCHKLVGLSRKCGVSRWDSVAILFHSRDPSHFRHLEFRKFLASDNADKDTGESGMVKQVYRLNCFVPLWLWNWSYGWGQWRNYELWAPGDNVLSGLFAPLPFPLPSNR